MPSSVYLWAAATIKPSLPERQGPESPGARRSSSLGSLVSQACLSLLHLPLAILPSGHPTHSGEICWLPGSRECGHCVLLILKLVLPFLRSTLYFQEYVKPENIWTLPIGLFLFQFPPLQFLRFLAVFLT